MEPKMKTLIAIPCMDKLDTSFVESLIRLQGSDYGVKFAASSLIYDARNKLGAVADANGAEYIFWLDSDMTFEPDTLVRMFKSLGDKDFITGLYFNRRPPHRPTIFKKAGFKQGEGREIIPIAEHYLDYPKNEIFEIEACGFGCVLMKTEMCLKVLEEQGLPFSPILGFGEDISFCIKARECGYKLYCDSSIKCGHTAHIIINEDTFEGWRNKDGNSTDIA